MSVLDPCFRCWQKPALGDDFVGQGRRPFLLPPGAQDRAEHVAENCAEIRRAEDDEDERHGVGHGGGLVYCRDHLASCLLVSVNSTNCLPSSVSTLPLR